MTLRCDEMQDGLNKFMFLFLLLAAQTFRLTLWRYSYTKETICEYYSCLSVSLNLHVMFVEYYSL